MSNPVNAGRHDGAVADPEVTTSTSPSGSRITHRFLNVGGIRMHVAEAGSGPLAVLLHGWPESWYSWRHQIGALAEAGFHVVAPDQRGYGRSDQPERVEDYTVLCLVDDVVGLIDALGEEKAVVVGHDWGAIVAWSAALMRPERIRAVSGLSVPHPWPQDYGFATPVQAMQAALGDEFFIVHFQQPDIPDADLARDPRAFLRGILFNGSAAGPGWSGIIPPGGILDSLAPVPDPLPAWITESDIDAVVADYERTGFTGGLHWYRNLDRNWELTAPWRDKPIIPPAQFIIGDKDRFHPQPETQEMIAGTAVTLPNLKDVTVLPGCGHWTQQERPAEVSEALLAFLRLVE